MDIAVRERPNHSLTQIDGPMSRPWSWVGAWSCLDLPPQAWNSQWISEITRMAKKNAIILDYKTGRAIMYMFKSGLGLSIL